MLVWLSGCGASGLVELAVYKAKLAGQEWYVAGAQEYCPEGESVGRGKGCIREGIPIQYT